MRQWKKIIEREANILSKYLVIQGVAEGPLFIMPKWRGIQNHFWVWKDGFAGVHYLREDLRRFSDAVVTEALARPDFVRRYREESKTICDHVVMQMRALTGKFARSSQYPEQLSEFFGEFCRLFRTLATTIIMTLEEAQGKLTIAGVADTDLTLLTSPTDLSFQGKEELNRLLIVREMRSMGLNTVEHSLKGFPKFHQQLSEHLYQYGWLPLNFEKECWDMAFLMRLLRSMFSDEHLEQRITALKNFRTHREQERNALYSRLDTTTQTIVDLFEACTFIRLYRANTFSRCWFEALPLLEAIAKKLQVSEPQLRSFNPQEIAFALETGTIVGPRQAMDRKQRFVIRILNDQYEQFEGNAVEEVLRQELPPESCLEQTLIKGSCAYPGVVKGFVKIISHPKQIGEVEPGAVLVCKMTDPDFIVAMSKAGAIVTEEGGITCHAAIVSREMKIPCLIGTKIATKVLNDGDYVEVDAGKGVVRKLPPRW